MDKYKRYQGVIVFVIVLVGLIFGAYSIIQPMVVKMQTLEAKLETKQQELKKLNNDLRVVQSKIKKIKDSISGSQKRIYYPVESDLGNDTLFFTLYNDVIEMVHTNGVKIKSLDYNYNPESDEFVKFGKDVYFVCDVNMELVSNYVNLGKLIQDLYQYPYYIKINELTVNPYEKDKKVLIANLSLRLYAHTAPDNTANLESDISKFN